MKDKIGDYARIKHISDSIIEIQKYTADIVFEEFENKSMIQFACIKQLEIIGEAANKITPHFKLLHSEIPWREIIGMRNILIHEYFGVDTKVIWDIIQNDISKLKQQIETIKL